MTAMDRNQPIDFNTYLKVHQNMMDFMNAGRLNDTVYALENIKEMLTEKQTEELKSISDELKEVSSFKKMDSKQMKKLYEDAAKRTYHLLHIIHYEQRIKKSKSLFFKVARRAMKGTEIKLKEQSFYFDLPEYEPNKRTNKKYWSDKEIKERYSFTNPNRIKMIMWDMHRIMSYHPDLLMNDCNPFELERECMRHDKLLLISAITINALLCFDYKKVKFLILMFCINSNKKIKAYALAGTALILCAHKNEAELYTDQLYDLFNRAEANESFFFTEWLCDIQLELNIMASTSDNLSVVQNELMPTITHNAQHTQPIEPSQSLIKQALQSLKALLKAGTDLNYMYFSNTTPNYEHLAMSPLFWFEDFSMYSPFVVPYLHHLKKMEIRKMEVIADSQRFCDVDLFTLCALWVKSTTTKDLDTQTSDILSSLTNNEETSDQFLGLLNQKYSDLKKAVRKPDFHIYVRHYFQNFYRMCRNPYFADEFGTILNCDFNLLNQRCLSDFFLHDIEGLMEIADSFVCFNKYDDAIDALNKLIAINNNDPDNYFNAGVCLARMNKFDEAIPYYEKALKLDKDKKRTLMCIVHCLINVMRFKEAYRYIKELEAIDNNDQETLLIEGFCLFNLKRYDEALNYFYKVDYLSDGKCNEAREFAVSCLLRTNQTQDAEKHCKELENITHNKDFLVEMAYVAWMNKDFPLTALRMMIAISARLDNNMNGRDWKVAIKNEVKDTTQLYYHFQKLRKECDLTNFKTSVMEEGLVFDLISELFNKCVIL